MAETNISMKRAIFWDIMACSPVKSSEVLDEYIASIFMVEE
jgi:hypothetical protein